MKSIKSVCFLICILVFTACAGQFGRLRKEQPRVTLALPAKQRMYTPPTIKRDSTPQPAANPGFLFVSANGDSVPVGVSAEWDSINKENITTVMMDEVVIAATSVRNTAERNGKINVEFVVTVPKELQAENWMVDVRPILLKGEEQDSLKELRFTGPEFRETQERQYRRYDRFLESIIPDSVNFYHTFVDYRSFERYLERLKWYKRGLERRWAVLDAKRRRPDPLMLRFNMFNQKASRKDSLLQHNMNLYAMRMTDRQQWRYDRAWAAMNDTLAYIQKYLPERFRFFNQKGEQAENRLKKRYTNKIQLVDFRHYADSTWASRDYALMLNRKSRLIENMTTRKQFFYDKALYLSLSEEGHSDYIKGVNPEIYYPRFIFFNDKMEKLAGKLYMYFRVKGARAESGEGVKLIKAIMAGRDTSSAYLDRSQLAQKYTKRYEKIRDFFPMFHFRRPESDTLPPSWLTGKRDTADTRRLRLAQFSPKEIQDHYIGQIQPDTTQTDTAAIRKRYTARFNFLHSLLPIYTFRRTLPDSVQRQIPNMKTVRDFEASLFDSASIIARYDRRYQRLRAVYPQYRYQRELCNIHPPAVKYANRQKQVGEKIGRINSLDSANLVKLFYNTQKIARNEARKAIRDEKFRDIVRFPFNPGARLDTIIYAADKVHFLYSENIEADENSSRLKVFLTGNVTSSNGTRYTLPMSDTLTFLVSSMTKFVDKTPRYVRKILTRDAEANTSVDFTFPRNRFRLDNTFEQNKQGLKKIHDITLALMTDPVYRIDSLTLFATSSPEGNWHINGEIARKRAESIKSFLEKDFTLLYDSLAVGTTIEIDEKGNTIQRDAQEDIPNLPQLVKIRIIPEDWNKLIRLINEDTNFPGNKNNIIELVMKESNPDRRELLIKRRYPGQYAYMREKLYPAMRAVDFRFSLSRKGMRQDTVFTTELDTAYERGVKYLEKRKYQQALDILRKYEDKNTALAYMSLGYDKAALRILEQLPQNAESKYLQAILQARLGDEQKAVLLLLAAQDMDGSIKFRANLDPELSVLVKKYALFREDEDEYNY